MGALRDRMIEEMKRRNISAATQRTYLYVVTRLTKYYGKAPDQLSREEIRAFLVHLIVERKLSPNGLTGYCSGLRFFYNETLAARGRSPIITERTESTRSGDLGPPIVSDRVLGSDERLLGRKVAPTE
jgi:integrase/recombinase XerD